MLSDRVDTWFEQWKREGLEEGREEGRAEGQVKGQAKTLGKQLQLKFGQLPDAISQKLQQASEAELDLWTERILFAESLDAVFTAG